MTMPIFRVLVMLTESEVQTEVDATGGVLELPGHCAYCGVIARCTDVHERGVEILDETYFVFERRVTQNGRYNARQWTNRFLLW